MSEQKELTKEPSFLDSLTITKEALNGPIFVILYGAKKIGKTWLLKYAPNPFFLAVEKGVERVPGVGKFTIKNSNGDDEVYMPKNKGEFFEMLKKFTRKGHDYKTLVIDSGMFVDKLFTSHIIAENPREKKGKDTYIEVTAIGDYNYGTGYDKLLAIWETEFFTALQMLHRRGISVWLIAHSREKTTVDDNGDEFKKIGVDMAEFGGKSVPALLTAKADAVLFMRQEKHTKKKATQFGAARTVADMDEECNTIVYTQGTTLFDAGVRTEKSSNVKPFYIIDRSDENTSKVIFEDLAK